MQTKLYLGRSVKICQSLDLNSNIYVSTDSQEYLDHINDLLENAPILRPDYLSGDFVSDIEVLTHAVHTCENFYKTKYKMYCNDSTYLSFED